MTRTTVIWSPHPDDETLRLGAYILNARENGDNLYLVAVCNGDGSGEGAILNMDGGRTSPPYPNLAKARENEQNLAWGALSGESWNILRLNISDGDSTTSKVNANQIVAIAKDFEAAYTDTATGSTVEHYAACHPDDAHADHRAVVNALKTAGLKVLRSSRDPEDTTKTGTIYDVPSSYMPNVERAARAYTQVGRPSVSSKWNALISDNYRSHILLP
jgi:LmbE family N-acetylglucosaminyl deacetylase